MLKKLVNECRFTLEITTQGPLLVKSGYATPHGPDMTPVLTYRNGQEQIFIPGSSLKGVFRSHLEKVIRTFNEPLVCIPYDESFCGQLFQSQKDNGNELSNPEVYKHSCPACRLFGSTFFIGRVAINDAYLPADASTRLDQFVEKRNGVGIDRFSGGAAAGALFDMLVVRTGVSFATDIYLRNFEIWQLGALMLLLQDMEDELIRVGSGRSRGLGKVQGTVTEVNIQYLSPNVTEKAENAVWGLGKFLNGESTDYGTWTDDMLSLTHSPDEEIRGVRKIQTFHEQALQDLKTQAMHDFVRRIQQWPFPHNA